MVRAWAGVRARASHLEARRVVEEGLGARRGNERRPLAATRITQPGAESLVRVG
tara:strand:- start:149 stop:310 length:162 start_codon:yes stop_codon:yes gene_type:complete